MTHTPPSDGSQSADELVRRARTDRDAFGRLFDGFYPPILAYCLRRLLVRAVAEDVAAEVFLKAATVIRDFTGSSEDDFRRWLYRIATNEINAHLRKSIRRRKLLEQAACLGTVKADVATSLLDQDSEIDWQAVYAALGELTDREQSLVSLRFFAGLPHEHIAGVLQMKVGTVRAALSRALEKLRGRLRSAERSRETPSGTARGGHHHG
jgi:RNA polymerase sigma-70 factor (ECF subfamily)